MAAICCQTGVAQSPSGPSRRLIRPHFRPVASVACASPPGHAQKQVVPANQESGTAFKGSAGRLRAAPCTLVVRRTRVVPLPPCRADASFAPSPPANNDPPFKEFVGKLKGDSSPPMSDIVWAAAGAFAAMAGFAAMDALLAPRGLSMTLGSFGAVCVLLFAAPKSPVSQKWNVLASHAGCALIGVLALSLFGPGWLARGTALAACVAYMQFTGSLHPPAAGLPLILIDAPKWRALNWWYVLFPGVLGCLYLFLLQEVVEFCKKKFRF